MKSLSRVTRETDLKIAFLFAIFLTDFFSETDFNLSSLKIYDASTKAHYKISKQPTAVATYVQLSLQFVSEVLSIEHNFETFSYQLSNSKYFVLQNSFEIKWPEID